MPTATFFRLPEEKRKRLIDACWAELAQVRFTDVSINRIITAAHIPRGSFYQYFTGNEWGNPRNYHLSLNSGKLGVERCVDMILACLEAEGR